MTPDKLSAEMDRALKLGSFLDSLASPTPKQAWLLRAAKQLREESTNQSVSTLGDGR